MILTEKLLSFVQTAIQHAGFPLVPIQFESPKQKEHGDLSSNVAFLLSKEVKKNPREVAYALKASMVPLPETIEKIEVAGAGFVNFFFKPIAYFEALQEIFREGKGYGGSRFGEGKKVLLEFVSANPTGPLNVVNARAAVIGDALANLLETVGFKSHREFYVNDVGNQMELFARSLLARYKEASGETEEIPKGGYFGDYLVSLASKLARGKKRRSLAELKGLGLKAMIRIQKKSLKNFGIRFDRWYFQSELFENKKIEKALKQLEKEGYLYRLEGALFFKTSILGDDKDRVVQKKDGEYSYFASDIAYHGDKFERKFDQVIDIFGPDHHGYIPRTRAAVQALGFDPENFKVLIVQQVNFMKGEKLVKMSKRAGELVLMDDLVNEVGRDVARYFFLQRSSNAPLDFDLELAKKTTPENPVFYIQYAHARIESIFRKAAEVGIKPDLKKISLEGLDLVEEKEMCRHLLDFPALLLRCAKDLEIHPLAFYILELAKQFQAYYSRAKEDDRYKIVNPENVGRTAAKLYLLKNIQIVLQNSLRILGISAPKKMEKKDAPGPL